MLILYIISLSSFTRSKTLLDIIRKELDKLMSMRTNGRRIHQLPFKDSNVKGRHLFEDIAFEKMIVVRMEELSDHELLQQFKERIKERDGLEI